MVSFGMTDLLLTQQALYKMKINIKSERENHRIMEWFRLERTFKGHPVLTPWAPSTKPGYSKPCPVLPWTFPGKKRKNIISCCQDPWVMGGVCSTCIFLQCGGGGSCALKQLAKGKQQCSLYQNQEVEFFQVILNWEIVTIRIFQRWEKQRRKRQTTRFRIVNKQKDFLRVVTIY